MKDEKCNVLVITLNAWNDMLSTGNTISNLFAQFPAKNISNIFLRNEPIDNAICQSYFMVTENDIVSSIIHHNKKAGKEITAQETLNKTDSKSDETQKKLLPFFRTFRPSLLLFAREMIWNTKKWHTEQLDDFIHKNQPDIIYMHGHCNIYSHKMLAYCKKMSNAKTVLFFGDDMYSYKSKSIFQNLYQLYLRKYLKKSIDDADLLFGGSENLCNEYSKLFSKKFNLLYKGCDCSGSSVKNYTNNPIKIMYAGNLLFGRYEAIVDLANIISDANKNDSNKFQLDIYSTTKLTEKQISAFESTQGIVLHCKKSYDEIMRLMNNADIALHIESDNKKQKRFTRLSFSTKIIDCMQSGAGMMIIGPRNIASVEYFVKNKLGFVASNKKEINCLLQDIKERPDMIIENAERLRKYAIEHHDIKNIRRDFANKILEILR